MAEVDRSGGTRRRALMVAPALLVTAGLFGGGLILTVVQSVGVDPVLGGQKVTFAAYRTLAADPAVRASLLLTLGVATLSTGLSAALGTALALLLRRAGRARLRFLAGLTLPVPHVLAATLVLLTLSQSGLLSRVTAALGLTRGPQDFPALLFDPLGVGVVLELVWKETPFVALLVLAALTRLDGRLHDVARSLGAGRAARFRQVTWPAIRPALLTACVLVFAFALGTVEVPLLLGATSPTTLSVLAYQAFTDTDLGRRPLAMALSTVLAGLGALLLWAYVRTGSSR
ncbi:ABC transporter permease [Deinococcus indicus]|nr:ABC transporter permease subunit [Deinococcus indicus]